MKKRNLLAKKCGAAMLAAVLGLSMTACGSTATGGTASAGAASQSGAAQVPTVTIWGHGGQEVRDALQAVADAHNADANYNTKARVEIQFVVSGTSE